MHFHSERTFIDGSFHGLLIARVIASLSMLAYQRENVVFEVKPATYLSRLSVRSHLEYYPTPLS